MEILEFCKQNYIDTIDTSMDYYKSEKVIGQAGYKNFNIITKLPKLDQSSIISPEKLEKIILNSLSKLKKKKFICITF